MHQECFYDLDDSCQVSFQLIGVNLDFWHQYGMLMLACLTMSVSKITSVLSAEMFFVTLTAVSNMFCSYCLTQFLLINMKISRGLEDTLSQ